MNILKSNSGWPPINRFTEYNLLIMENKFLHEIKNVKKSWFQIREIWVKLRESDF